MSYLIKSLFRYLFKNKLSAFLLTVILTISVFLLLALGNLSNNLINSYDKLVKNGNLANIVINENYSTTYPADPNLDEEQAKQKNEEEFKDWLKSQNLEFREFTSLDYTNTANGKIVKVISYDNDYSIDKLVIYGGNQLYNNTFNFQSIIDFASQKVNDSNNVKFAKKLENINARRELLYLASKSYWTDPSIATLFNKTTKSLLEKYNDPSKEEYDPLNWNNSKDERNINKYMQVWLDKNSGKLVNKKYRLNFEVYVGATNPKVIGNILNYSSQFAVVPNYVLENQNKSYIPTDWYSAIKKYLTKDSYLDELDFENKILSKIPEKYKIYVDSLPYIIVGEGISPDFMYPVFSFERITPNINEEVLLYSTSDGFEYAFNSNRSNVVDKYIVAKYDGNVNQMVNKINEVIPTWMTTAGAQWAFAANDVNNTFQPVAVRIDFLPKLVNTQTAISNVLSIFVLVLAITIFIIMIKKFIGDNQVNLAILRSNGYKKRWLIWSTSLFSLIPCLVGGIFGYILAYFTQSFALGLYSFYWVIPMALTTFNPLIMIGAILLPFLIFTIVSVVTSHMIIRKGPGQLMNESSKFKVSRLSKFIIKPLPRINILTKFRLSIAFSSISRLIVLIIMLSLTSISLMFAFGTNNSFENAKTVTYVDKKYNMAFDLETPTVQGGQYLRTTYDSAGKAFFDKNKTLLNFNTSGTDSNYATIRGIDKSVEKNNDYQKFYDYYNGSNVNLLGKLPNNHWPSINDSSWQKDDLNYLKYKIESQSFVDVLIGYVPPFSTGTNPWDIARSLAPENVQNYSNKLVRQVLHDAYNDKNIYFTKDLIQKKFPTWNKSLTNSLVNKTIKQIFNDIGIIKEINPNDINDNLIYFTDDENGKYYTIKNTASTAINNKFLAVMGYLFAGTPYFNNHINEKYLDSFYKVLYNYVPMDEDDETYTYVNAKTNLSNQANNDIKLIGIKPNSKYIQLKNMDGKNLNNLLWINDDEKKIKTNDNSLHNFYKKINLDEPQNLIINESAKYQYGLDIGDEIVINPQNESTRYNINNTFGKDINNKEIKLKVVGIYRSSQNPEFYINQRVANKILNMDEGKIINTAYYQPDDKTIGYEIDPFNGFFTIEENPKIITNCLSLYTINGIGPANDKFFKSQNYIDAIKKTLNSGDDLFYKIAKNDLAFTLGFMDDTHSFGDKKKLDEWVQQNGGVNDKIAEKIIDIIVDNYGSDAYFSLVHNVDSIKMYIQLFDNTSYLTNSLLTIVIVIIAIVSSLSSITIAFDLLNSSLSIAGILKALGYSDSQNIITFTSIFIPSLLFAIIISIPLTLVLFNIFKSFIYSFSNILLTLSLNWWIPIISLLIIGVAISALIIYVKEILKRKSITDSISRY